MFLTKLVEKASFTKKPGPGGSSDGLKADDLDPPRLVFHYGIPSGAILLAYHTIQKILAVSTRDGRIKLFGKDGGQTLLESPAVLPSKFLQFLEIQPTLVNINVNNQIEVWDLEKKCLSHMHEFKKEITSCTAIPYAPYLFIGDSAGDISVLKLNRVAPIIEQMQYRIPFTAARGATSQVAVDTAPIYLLPQPSAESKRVLIICADGFITLWSIQESKVIFTTGGLTAQPISHETKKVTAASWCCPFGSKVAVGYSNGDIFLWSIPSPTNPIEQMSEQESSSAQSTPIFKLNLGYKLEKIPIAKLRWTYGDGKANRLYVIGSSDSPSANLLQVVLLNEQTESRTIKLGLHPSESSLDMEITTSFNSQSKQKHDSLFLLGKSGHVYVYEDYLIEKYLLQSKSSPSLPKELMVKLPFADSSITAGKFITDFPYLLYSASNDYDALAKDILPLFTFETAQKDGSSSTSQQFRGFSKTKNIFITGHSNGAIKFWDASCPLLRPSLSLTQQSENDVSLSGVPITALYCTGDLEILISGDQSGTVRIYIFKAETFAPDTSFLSLQGVSKKGGNNLIQSIKVLKVKGAVTSIDEGYSDKHLAVGSDQGYVSLIDVKGLKVLYERQFTSELSAGIVSVQFETCNVHGFEKNVSVVATRDSSVMALETETGNTLSTNPIRPKKPSRALFMRILDSKGSDASEKTETSTGSSADGSSPKQHLVVICSEKAAYVYSLLHIVQGIKKVHYKKKFHSASCCCASILGTSSALVLLFSSGKVEIRSLPELSLLKETSVRGCRPLTTKQNPISNSLVSFSSSGDAIVVEGDQEAFFLSVSLQNDVYRFLDFASEVYDKDLMVPQSAPVLHKEKKKSIFGFIIKDITGTKEKSETNAEAVDARESTEHLSTIFSVANFPIEVEREEKLMLNESDDNLNIDDIEIEDPEEKPTKGVGVMAALNKQKISNKFQAFKGKLKHMKVKTDKTPANETPHEEKPETVDDIKKRYGYTSPVASEQSVASIAKTKLNENLKKLQGINMKTTEMQDTAQSFSSMAKQVLRFAEKENDKGSS